MNYVKLLIILLVTPLTNAEVLHCRVVGVTDGDTITCLTNKKEQLKIRLYQIDAPEKKQAFGTRSRQALSNLIFNKWVRVETHGTDKYRRMLGTVYGERATCELSYYDVNLEMIRQGMAWYYPFAKKNGKYELEQEAARTYKIGLWSSPHISPWDFRKQKRIKK